MKILAALFCLALCGDVLAIWSGFQDIHFWLKPVLMPLLMAFVMVQFSKGSGSIQYLILIGLFFAWAGDIFLMFEKDRPVFFLAGLGSFLCTHIFYILMFLKINKGFAPYSKITWGIWAAIAGYGIALVNELWPGLGEMKAPVLIYAICICTMAMLSVNTPVNLSSKTRVLLASGAFLFVLSDSILAVNKFLGAGGWAPPAIMLTYGLAQLAIAAGVSNLPKAASGEALAPAV